MSITMSELKTNGFALMDYDNVLRAQVEEAAQSWQQFCQQTIKSKQLLQANSDSAGCGYEVKDGIGSHADRKENFDISLSQLDYLSTLHTDSPISQHFIEQASQLAKRLIPLANQFGKEVKEIHEVSGLSDCIQKSTDSIFIRFLHYFGDRSVGEIIAEPHADQSGFTLHLFETDTGCQRFDPSRRMWQDLPVEPGKTVVFPAMQLQLYSNSNIKALAHRVIANEKTKDKGRYTIVCFVRLADVPVYDKETHGRLQEMPAGFNYDMPHTEFAKLFKSA